MPDLAGEPAPFTPSSPQMHDGALHIVDAAIALYRQGLYPIPLCWPLPDGSCGCGRDCSKAGKAALVGAAWLSGERVADESTIRAWWAQWPNANLGIALRPSGLLVVDCDSVDALDEASGLGLPPGPIVR